MQNAWLLYLLMPAHNGETLDQLEFRNKICNLYYIRYHAQNRHWIGHSLGRAQLLSSRIPLEIQPDSSNHLIEFFGTQRQFQ